MSPHRTPQFQWSYIIYSFAKGKFGHKPWHWNVVRGCCANANPDRALLKEVLGGQYNYREGGRQVLRQGAKGRRRNRKWQCSKDPCAQKVSDEPKVQVEGAWIGH